MKRTPGTGSITPRRGRFLARVIDASGARRSVGTYDTHEEATQALADAGAALAADADQAARGLTLAAWGETWLSRRLKAGLRAIRADRSRWACHVAPSALAAMPLDQIKRRDVRAWLDDVTATETRSPGAAREQKRVSNATAQHCLNLVRRALADAVDDELVASNPAADVSLSARPEMADKWTYLQPDEIRRLLVATTPAERMLVAFAIGSGLREGEQWALELADVHLDDATLGPHVVVRYGGPKRSPTKTGKLRIVPLFGLALAALRAWLDALPTFLRKPKRGRQANPHGLVFPMRGGGQRGRSKPPHGWRAWLAEAKIGRRVRWHDLRHTCASALISGWWGPAWSLPGVRDLLGHTSITTTERYAHLAPSALRAAGALTDPSGEGSAKILTVTQGEEKPMILVARHSGLEPLTFGSGGLPGPMQDQPFGEFGSRLDPSRGPRLARTRPDTLAPLVADLERWELGATGTRGES